MSSQNLQKRASTSPLRSMSVEKGSTAEAAAKATVRVQAIWLLLWLVNNVGITMGNKQAFSRAGFKYPLVASAFHMLCNWLGTMVYFLFSSNERATIVGRQWLPLIMFSVVFSLNISVGNYSSMLVSVKFNQVMRSLVPAVVMLLGMNIFRKMYSRDRKLAIVPIILGVMLACFGESQQEVPLSAMGLVVTSFCVLLAALKVVLSGEMLTGSNKLPPLDLLSRMAPLACLQMTFFAFASGEVARLQSNWEELSKGWALWLVALTGVGSFSLNLCSLQANKVTSPLTLSIMANVKQVLLIVADAVLVPDSPCTVVNMLGIGIVIVASFRYSMLTIKEGQRAKAALDNESPDAPVLPK